MKRVKTYFWIFSTSSASSSALLLTVGGRLLWRVISFGVWGWVSFKCSPFTGDGPDKNHHTFNSVIEQSKTNLIKNQLHTFLLTPATAQVVALRGAFLELLYLLSHGHVRLRLLHLSFVAPRQVKGFGHGSSSNSLCLKEIKSKNW